METDCILHVQICRLGAVTFIAVVSPNDTLCINHISYNTKHSTKDKIGTSLDRSCHNTDTHMA